MNTATRLAPASLPATAPAAARAVFTLLRQLRIGTLDVQLPDGGQWRFGTGAPDEPHAAVRLHNWRVCAATLKSGDIGFAEAYLETLSSLHERGARRTLEALVAAGA